MAIPSHRRVAGEEYKKNNVFPRFNGMRSRAWCFTWNNPPDTSYALLDELACRYLVYGKEFAPATRTPHLQGYVYYTHPRSLSAVRSDLPGCHLDIARGTPQQNFDYCSKDGDFIERGDRPLSPADKGAGEIERYALTWTLAKAGRLEEIDADIRVRLYSTLLRIQRDFMPEVQALGGVCGVWIHGLSGCGKTRSVLSKYPEAYIKPRSIWWDGYQSEPVVLLDDLDNFDVRLGGLLKHWADFAPFIAEKKGGSIKIRPERLIVTSQFTIEEIWSDTQTRDALLRRFTVVPKTHGQAILI